MNVTDQYQNRERVLIPMNQIFNVKNIIKIGTWNVRTLYQSGRLSQALWEMEAYRLDVLGIDDIRWIGQCQTINNGITILYSGREDVHTDGVDILLSCKAACALIGWTPVNHHVITSSHRDFKRAMPRSRSCKHTRLLKMFKQTRETIFTANYKTH